MPQNCDLGIGEAKSSDWGLLKALHPEDRDRYSVQQQQAINQLQAYKLEYRLLGADGNYHWFVEQATPTLGADGMQDWVVSCTPRVNQQPEAPNTYQQAEAAWRTSEQKLALHVQQTPLAVIEWNLNFEVIDWNPAAEKIFGYSKNAAIGNHAVEIILPASEKERVNQIWNDLIQAKGGTRSTNENLTKDGSTIICEWYNTPLVNRQGDVIGVVSLVQDITERIQLEKIQHCREAELEQRVNERTTQLEVADQIKAELLFREQVARAQAEAAQQRWREIVDGLTDAIVWECDPDAQQFSFVSQNAENILGYPVERWLTQPNFWVNLIHPEEREWIVKFCREQADQGHEHEFEYRCIAADGRVVWLRDRIYVVRDRQGQTEKLRGLMIDITASKQAEEELQESESRFRNMADTAPVMIWLSGTDSLFNWFNQPWLDFTGRTLEQEIGNGWVEGVHPDDLPCYLNTYLSAFNTRQCFKLEYRLRRTDGEYRWIISNGVPLFTSNGEFTGYIGSGIDISERKASEEELKVRAQELTYLTTILAQTNAALEKRNHELDQFAYVTSHDLKAPLRAIANLSEWIEEDLGEQLTGDTRHQMDLLRGRVHRLEALIDGLLQYSRVGRIETTTSLVSVADLLAEVIDSLAPPDTFTITVAPNLPSLVTERLLLAQVFTNLLSNAIKHHPRSDGKVEISGQNQGSFYQFAITDDGAGIALEYHKKVFGIFQTLAARDKSENTGIGLAIVKKIVEAQGGTIHIESQVGQGTTFHFTWSQQPI